MSRRIMQKKLMLTLSFIMVISLLVPGAKAESGSRLDLTEYGVPEALLKPINSAVSIYDGAVGKEDGHDVMYTTTKGVPAIFNVVDLDDYKLLRSIPLPGEGYSWHHEVAPDGSVYVAGGDKLWKYSPATKQIQAVADFGAEGPWSLVTDEAGNAYVGTYPGGKVLKYDSATGQVTDYGRMIGAIAQEYVRSIAYHNGIIYAGTAHSQIVRLNPATGEKTNIAGSLGDTGFVYDLNTVDDRYLFARYSESKKMYVYDLETQQWLDTVMTNVTGLHVADSLNSNVYFVADGKLKAFNLDTRTVQVTPMAYGSGLRGADWAVMENDPDLPGLNLVTIQFGGSVTFFNIETSKVKVYPPRVDAGANPLHEIETGNDGKLYMSTLGAAAGAIYDPATGKNVPFTIGQADSMLAYENKVYMGVYPNAYVYEFDTSLPPGAQNPKLSFQVGSEQDRIGVMTSGDGKVYMGSVSTYGKLGGAVTVFDPKATDASRVKVYRNIVPNQSVVGLAYKDGKLFGSTNINNGLGSEPTETEAKMFVMDVATGTKTAEFSLNIEGVSKPQFIGRLTVGPDGLIWGGVNGFVFALDPDSLQVVKSKQLFFGTPYFGAWSSVNLKWSDGILYALFGTELFAVDPATLARKSIAKAYNFNFDEEGNLYYSSFNDKTLLERIRITTLREPLPSSLYNSSFEMPTEGGSIPGWTASEPTVAETAYGVSEERKFGGEKSLKLTDRSLEAAVTLESDKVDVLKREVYTGKARVYVAEGTARLVLRFYNHGGHLMEERAVQISGGAGEWQEVEVSIEAHESVRHASVALSTNGPGMAEVYFDDVQLTGEFPKEE